MKKGKKLALIFSAAILLGTPAFSQENQEDNIDELIQEINDNKAISDNSSVASLFSFQEKYNTEMRLEELIMSYAIIDYMYDTISEDLELARESLSYQEGATKDKLEELYASEYFENYFNKSFAICEEIYEILKNNNQPINIELLDGATTVILDTAFNAPNTDEFFESLGMSKDSSPMDLNDSLLEVMERTRILNAIYSYEVLKDYVNESNLYEYEYFISTPNLTAYKEEIDVIVLLQSGDYSILDASGTKTSEEMEAEYRDVIARAYMKNAEDKLNSMEQDDKPSQEAAPYIEDILPKPKLLAI